MQDLQDKLALAAPIAEERHAPEAERAAHVPLM